MPLAEYVRFFCIICRGKIVTNSNLRHSDKVNSSQVPLYEDELDFTQIGARRATSLMLIVFVRTG